MNNTASEVLTNALSRKKTVMEIVTREIYELSNEVRDKLAEQRAVAQEISELEAALSGEEA